MFQPRQQPCQSQPPLSSLTLLLPQLGAKWQETLNYYVGRLELGLKMRRYEP